MASPRGLFAVLSMTANNGALEPNAVIGGTPRKPSVFDRKPPHNADAERAVLGACLLNPDAVSRAVAVLGSECGEETFYVEAHRQIFAAIIALHRAGMPIDEITLPTKLIEHGNLEAVGGSAYLMGLTGAVPTSANVEYYAGIVHDMYVRRNVIDAARRLEFAAFEPHDIQPLFSDLQTCFDGRKKGHLEFADLANWQALAEQPIPWLFDKSVPDECVTMFGAQGGIGKSLLATGLALSAAMGRPIFPSFKISRPVPVMFFSGEDSLPMVCRRFRGFGAACGIPDEEITRATGNMRIQALGAQPFLTPGRDRLLQPSTFYREVADAVHRTGAKMLVLDTARKFGGYRNENDNVEVAQFIELCAQLSAQEKCAIIILHHSSKMAANDTEAKQGDLRGGDAFAAEARCVWILKKQQGGFSATNTKMNCWLAHGPTAFTFTPSGVIAEVSQEATEAARRAFMTACLEYLSMHPDNSPTMADVESRRRAAKDMHANLEGRFLECSYTYMTEALRHLVADGLAEERKCTTTTGSGRAKFCLQPTGRKLENDAEEDDENVL